MQACSLERWDIFDYIQLLSIIYGQVPNINVSTRRHFYMQFREVPFSRKASYMSVTRLSPGKTTQESSFAQEPTASKETNQ